MILSPFLPSNQYWWASEGR